MIENILKIYEDNKDIVDNTSLDFLTDEYITNTSKEIHLDNNITDALIDTKNTVLNNEAATKLLKTYFSLYFNEDKTLLPDYFDASSILSNNKDLFFLLVVICKIKDLKEFYKEKNIPSNILYDTLSDINIWTNNHKVKTGYLGLSQLNWLYYHLKGDLFRLGRLQFKKCLFNDNIMLFKQLITNFPLILSYPDIKYDAFGKVTTENEDFISTYIESDVTITANPIREGKCDTTPITINKCDYSREIVKDSELLEIHIPQGEKLDIADCIDSMKEAIKFFYKYFDSSIVKGFTCTSWLLNRNFRYILPEDSNIRKFASMFYEYPSSTNYNQMYTRVFSGETNIDTLSLIENKTKLQETIIKAIKEGLTFEDSSIIYPSYDMRKLEKFRL